MPFYDSKSRTKVSIMKYSYYSPAGGLPNQEEAFQDRAIFTNAYAFIPRRVLTDIVTSLLPNWEKTKLWVLARPMTGFAETFSHYLMDISPGGGSNVPDEDEFTEHVIFVTSGAGKIKINGESHSLSSGSYIYLPPKTDWSLINNSINRLVFHWFRKRYQKVNGVDAPPILVTSDSAVEPIEMPGSNGNWLTSRFVSADDIAHDMHVNIVTFHPGGTIPFAETHVMEHGIYVLCGSASYRFNSDIIDVEAGDYAWLRAFCPQCCTATGKGLFRYLLYKDVNRHMGLQLTKN